jgi:hypothetical protein
VPAFTARAEEIGPYKILVAYLPWPDGWTKHDRIGQTREGRRFLSKEARAYRAIVTHYVTPALPTSPWFDSTRDWRYSMLFLAGGKATDHDQHSGGILDDLVAAGLAKNDDNAYWLLPEYERTTEPAGVFVFTRQTLV